ncbi:NTP transferase domain-containing protein [Mycobacterium sp. CBMA293]|uniref:nucleotidyltransferase family protein n=1 Tax=unclassified Mycolicibacterium TaxID=2636767 RepID=UPI0012DC21F5|nr:MULTISPECIES: NTP transferase domain-containing protein [unclassified Mycolicibacterium]MUL56748.1 NTP transferase domain-containing protein [Mycolicibacterium sp. CBMA 335]MUM10691.1 NTP transferase domain-containing protein [Mycolicibacterium sp. CBMA 293]MUL45228.1 NTP transferase domain-containing protein [Mycolicibacterium sp. CBMA 360]MUL69787.1 NTP transferase domain-containing protein [Mycolicibacterium sp. CBMA 311]MUL91835.1 NTP transferase domain-containing protein [Mycolicibacte
MRTNTVGIVLAAGGGERFGMPKVLADNGRWLDRAVTALADGGVGRILVALGAAVVPVPPPAAVLVVPDWRRGLSVTVAAAVRAARTDPDIEALMLHTIDTPTIGSAVVDRVLAEGENGLARAVFHGVPGHPVLIGRAHWEELLRSLSGDVGAGPFLATRGDLVSVECSDLGSGGDIDE